jgi:hypothetical protein
MQRVTQFAFRVSDNERQAITALAERLQRSQSDAVRFVVIEAAKQLAKSEAVSEPQREGSNLPHMEPAT